MEKSEIYQKVQKAERSRGCFTYRRTSDYIKNGMTLLVVIGIIFTTKTANAQYSQPSDDPQKIDLTLLRGASEIGAVCLDGSAPAFHFSRGFGSGADNWLVHLEGGGLCNTMKSCSERKQSPIGSSKFMEKMGFGGILSSNSSKNPEFYNWNKIKVRYCDGAFFSGTRTGEYEYNTTGQLFFRGQLIWDAVMVELMELGIYNAKQAFLTGCSAGGLATLIHCDSFAELFTPGKVNVKCLSDAGFFIDEKDISGGRTIRSFFHGVVKFQGMVASLNKACVSELKPFTGSLSQCLFPQNFVKNIKAPVFLVNPSYDALQIENVLLPPSAYDYWAKCTKDIAQCSPSQLYKLHAFRDSMLKVLRQYKGKKNIGMFIDSCFAHCQTDSDKWHLHSPRINNKTIAEAVGDWYFNRKRVHYINNCRYPCNPTCSNKVWE
ncbi:hypothetical protein MKX03_009497 [Papaver bracteatum]|nr:hypothetical protein MKX03_009496 [Papaver bracteatum]KAI3881429.1 hypothetical protein MKX03_009497 [Papaver bracteatum]